MSSLFIYCLLSYAIGLDVMSIGPIDLLALFDDACSVAYQRTGNLVTFARSFWKVFGQTWPGDHPGGSGSRSVDML